jgi:vitamin B12 transporter
MSPDMPRFELAPAATVLLLLSTVAGAQQPVAADTGRLLQPVVVTATRVPREVERVPATVTVVSGESLRARGVVRVADALAGVPGLTLVGNGSTGAQTSLFMRGANSNAVKVLVDGVAVNAPGGAVDLAHLTTDNVDRIEVVRGPASVLYGSDAAAGVVQIFTRDGLRGRRASLAARGGSFGSSDIAGSLAGMDGPVHWSVGGHGRRTDGELAFNNAYRNRGGSGVLGLVGENADLRLSARLTDARFHYPTDGSGAVVDSNSVRDEQRWTVALDAGRRWTPRLETRALVTLGDVEAESSDLPDSPGDTAGFYSSDASRIVRRAADLRANIRVANDVVMTMGGEWSRQRVSSAGESRFASFPPETSRFREHRDNVAAFLQVVGDAGRLSYVLGARVDDNDAFGRFNTARAALSWRVAGATRLRAAIGNAFKEPSFEETFSTSYSVGNQALEPERTVSAEVGIEHRFVTGDTRVSATVFGQRFRDLIQFVGGDASTNFLGSNENLAAARAWGVELEARGRPAGTIEVGAALTLLDTKVEDAGNGAFGTFVNGERLLRRPARSARVDASWTPHARIRLDVVALLTGRRDDHDFVADRRIELDAFERMDLAGSYSLPARLLAFDADLTLRVENVFDTRIEPVKGFRAPGRTLLAGIRLSHGG